MKKKSLMIAGIFLALMMVSFSTSTGDEAKGRHRLRTGVYVDMTEEFYRALQEGDHSKKLSTNSSENYLHQIAIATRYTVETNLQILNQQERIIKLLEEIRDKK